MKILVIMRMDFNFVPCLFMVFGSLTSIAESIPSPSINLSDYPEPFSTTNFTRPKRQLFREDIPEHRPLSGNVHAHHHGFPLPGRWSDGLRSEHKPKPFVFPSHQQYIDMLDNNQHGHYHDRLKIPQISHQSVGFGGDVHHPHHSGGGSAYGPPDKPSFFDHIFDYDYGHGQPGPKGQQVHYDGPGPEYGPVGPSKAPPQYGPPQPQKDAKRPKTFVHYHPVQYGNVLNFPDHGHNSHNNNFSPAYGPPNHSSGQPIGPNIESGFLPSTGPFLEHGGGGSGDHYNNHGSYHTNEVIGHTNHANYPGRGHKQPHFQFDPFKIFSHPSPPPKSLDDVPIPIPILAQFHSAKPIKFQKIKHPVHIIYSHNPKRHPGPQYHPHRSRPFRSNWLHQYGL